MLVLTRKTDEAVYVGDNIKIVVADIRGDRVRLAFEAPADVAVHRTEIFDRIKDANNPVPDEA